MNPERFYIPGYMGMGNNMISARPMLKMASSAPRGIGLFSRITNGIRSVNWGGLLNNANKTLNVMNQAIPLVRQAGPMVNNMRSMLKIAKVFGSETTSGNRTNNSVNEKQITNNNLINNSNNNTIQNNISSDLTYKEKEDQNINVPNFFI